VTYPLRTTQPTPLFGRTQKETGSTLLPRMATTTLRGAAPRSSAKSNPFAKLGVVGYASEVPPYSSSCEPGAISTLTDGHTRLDGWVENGRLSEGSIAFYMRSRPFRCCVSRRVPLCQNANTHVRSRPFTRVPAFRAAKKRRANLSFRSNLLKHAVESVPQFHDRFERHGWLPGPAQD